jgi:hypothetical protein
MDKKVLFFGIYNTITTMLFSPNKLGQARVYLAKYENLRYNFDTHGSS